MDQATLDKAHSWLDKAIKFEADGKQGLAEKSFSKALELENEAFNS